MYITNAPLPDAARVVEPGGPGRERAPLQVVRHRRPPQGDPGTESISQKVFIKMFCKSRFPHKSVNLS